MIRISKPFIGEEEISAVAGVMRSGMVAQGPKVAELEKKFSQLCGTKHGIALNSGTAALHSALKVVGVREGDEVLTTPFTFIATANSILMQNAVPVFCDIEEDSFNIDTDEIAKRITKKTKAAITVDLYGQLCDYGKIEKLCADNGVRVVEDAAQSVGAHLGGRKAGSFGDAAAFSFYATKNIHSGEGGLMATNNEEYAKKAALFRQHGRKDLVGYDYDDLGYNYRMTDMAAAIVLEQLKRLEGFTARRRENAKQLNAGLKGLKGIKTPVEKYGAHVYHQYTIRVEEDFPMGRDGLSAFLQKKGIESRAYYPLPLHLCTQFRKLGYREGDFPVSERLSRQVLSLPVHPSLSKEDVAAIISAVREAAEWKK